MAETTSLFFAGRTKTLCSSVVMAQPVTCSATILRLIGCGPVSSETGATSSQLFVAAESFGRRKRNAAPLIDAKTAASGRNLKNERRDVSTVMFVHLHAFDGEAFEFLPSSVSSVSL